MVMQYEHDLRGSVPVRKGHGPLHIGVATGRGYRTACGKPLMGANVEVPQPRIPRLTKRALEDFYAKCWENERICKTCDRSAP